MAKRTTVQRKKNEAATSPAARETVLDVPIERYGPVEWRRCKWLQPEELKKQSATDKKKLKASLLKNGFASPFFVWNSGKTTYILDGHHRQPALRELEREGVAVPDTLPGIWIRAANMKAARRFILLYSSRYARMDAKSLGDFITEFDTDEIIGEVSLPELKVENLDFGDTKADSEKPEYPIIAEFSEAYHGVTIFCDNDVDWANLRELLDLKTKRSYKCEQVGEARIISYRDFIQAIEGGDGK